MSSPIPEWIEWAKAISYISHELAAGPTSDFEQSLFDALSNSGIRSRYTRETQTPPFAKTKIETFALAADWWRKKTDLNDALGQRPGRIELNFQDIREWLKPENRRSSAGRPPVYDWEAFWIEAVLFANKPDGLPDTQTEFVEHMSAWFEDTYGASPSDSQLKDRAQKLYRKLPTKKKVGN